MKNIKIALQIVFLSLGLFFVSAAYAKAESVQQFTANIVINTDSSVSVTETILYDSEGTERHGIYRTIDRTSATGKKMSISHISITDTEGTPYQIETTYGSDEVKIRIGDPDATFSGKKTYVVSYTAYDAISYLSDMDELYWNITGNDWEFPINTVSASIVLPNGASALQESCYVGVRGSSDTCDIEHESVVYEKPLIAGEGLTAAVGFPTAYIEHIDHAKNNRVKIIVVAALVPITTFVLMYRRWSKKGRDPKGAGVIIAQYDVPDNLTPLEVGIIVYEKSRPKDISAELIYLATKGYLKIRQEETKILGLVSNRDYTLTLLKNPTDLPNEFDRKILARVFSDATPGTAVKISELRNEFYTAVPGIFSVIRKIMLDKQYYSFLPHTPKKGSLSLRTAIAIVIGYGFPFIAISLFDPGSNLSIVIGSIVVSIIIFGIFYKLMPAKTERGVATKEYLLGLKEYLQIAEKDRLAFHNAPDKKPELFEHLLPYAMIFGVEKEWAKEFRDIYTIPPQWYESANGGVFNALVLTHSLSAFSYAANISFTRAPGNSGSGGGGFSGGGGGGGGGGSW